VSQSVQEIISSDQSVMNALLSDQYTQKLEALAQGRAEEYKANKPYPHIYFDDFLPVEVAEAALRDFPEPKEVAWHAYRDVNQHKKLAFDAVEKLPPSIRDVLYFLNTRPMLKFLETLTGPGDFWKCTPTSATTTGFAWTGALMF
jgi:hypothetical protein